MRINFDFADLQAFLAVAETLSFHRAATQLAISQSAVTRRTQKLESALGVELFERTTRSLRPTLACRDFESRAQAMLNDASEAMRALGDSTLRYQYQRNEVVNIATIPTLTNDLLPRVLSRFKAETNQVRINILDFFAGDVNEAVATGEADFGIGFIGIQEPGLEFDYLLDDKFVAAMHRDHSLAGQQRLRWSELDAHSLIVPQKGGGNRLLIDTTLARSKQFLNWSYQARYSATILELVRMGIGVAILPASAIPHRKDANIVAVPLTDPEISRSLGGIRRSGRSLTAKAQLLYDLFVEECRGSSLVD